MGDRSDINSLPMSSSKALSPSLVIHGHQGVGELFFFLAFLSCLFHLQSSAYSGCSAKLSHIKFLRSEHGERCAGLLSEDRLLPRSGEMGLPSTEAVTPKAASPFLFRILCVIYRPRD